MNRRRSLLLLVPVLLCTRGVWAASLDAKERMARTACLAGDYTKGVALLAELFVATTDPTYVYNQGRCFEQNRRYEDAIARFQEYLRIGKRLGKEAKNDAQKHISDCKALLAEQPGQPSSTTAPPLAPPPAPTFQPAPTPSPPAVPPTPVVVEQTKSGPGTDSGAGLRTAGIVTAAVGGAALVTGLLLNLKVNSMADSLQKTDGYSDGRASDRKTYETLGWVSYGAGAAFVATGAVLYVLGLRGRPAASTSASLVPIFTADHAGVAWKGAF